jgi:tRNA pseudouridine38-40 synthase
MRTLKLTIAYDGSNYVGWQRQLNGLAIQQVVEDAFAPLVGGERRTIAGAGRTDAGVHALGQVASVHVDFDHAPSSVQRALNVRLPFDIRVLGAIDVTPGFHAQFHATGKSYRYRIATTTVLSPFDRWFVWHAPGARNVEAMQQAAERFVGRHDFASFQPADSPVRDTVRTIERLAVRDAGGEIVIDVEGDGFLRHMVRTIAGTLAEVGSGARHVDSISEVIAARDRRSAGPTLPASGLTLVSVRY